MTTDPAAQAALAGRAARRHCRECDGRLRRRWTGYRLFGCDGCGQFCTLSCAHRWAVRVANAIDLREAEAGR